ncbi:MAG TPA: hypothetical protein VG963_15655, partial [Polyangiaceae bacterium]|nr:hypothetical protein [Polyangiaceae bacterium]
MGRADEEGQTSLQLNGINGRTGQYLVPSMTVASAAADARAGMQGAAAPVPQALGLPAGADVSKLAHVGWAVIFAPSISEEIKEALRPLLERRRVEADALFRVFDYASGQAASDWLGKKGVGAGVIQPENVPYYLLIVGSPEEIPFEFQYGLSLEYAVGRITFDSAAEYAAYARSLIAYEDASDLAISREIVYWATRHAGDGATQLSADLLVQPLNEGVAPVASVASRLKFRSSSFIGMSATRNALLQVFEREAAPALLFTASHGMGFEKGDALLRDSQGA